MKKRLWVPLSIIIISLFLISCQTETKISDEQLKEELQNVSTEELNQLSEEVSKANLAGQAYYQMKSFRVSPKRIQAILNTMKFSAKVYKIDPLLTPNPEIIILKNLDESGYLKGKYIDVVNHCSNALNGCIAGPRVYSSSNIFIYNPIEYGESNYFGSTDATDQGHQFDETMAYYAGDTIAQYFYDNFGFIYPKKINIKLYTPGTEYCGGIDMGCTDANGNIYIPPPKIGSINNMRDVKGIMHEYVHNAYHQFRSNPPTVLDEGYAVYFSSSIVNDSRYSLYLNPIDPKNIDDNYNYNTEYKILAFAASLWDTRKALGKEILDKLVYQSWQLQPMSGDPAIDGMVSLIDASKQKYGATSPTHKKNKEKIINAFANHGIVCKNCS